VIGLFQSRTAFAKRSCSAWQIEKLPTDASLPAVSPACLEAEGALLGFRSIYRYHRAIPALAESLEIKKPTLTGLAVLFR